MRTEYLSAVGSVLGCSVLNQLKSYSKVTCLGLRICAELIEMFPYILLEETFVRTRNHHFCGYPQRFIHSVLNDSLSKKQLKPLISMVFVICEGHLLELKMCRQSILY